LIPALEKASNNVARAHRNEDEDEEEDDDLGKVSDHDVRAHLVQCLEAVSPWLDAGEAGKAANALIAAIRGAPDETDLNDTGPDSRSEDLRAVAVLLDAGDAGKAAEALIAALGKSKVDWTSRELARTLREVRPRLDAGNAGKVAEGLIAYLDKSTEDWTPRELAELLDAFSARLDSSYVSKAADFFLVTFAMSETYEGGTLSKHHDLAAWARAFHALLTRQHPDQPTRRVYAVTGAVGFLSGSGHAFALPALLQPAAEPLPAPLPAQVLVDLLKHPLCVGPARRVVLDQLQRRYGQPFADQWDFVRFARRHQPDLDLTSPPRRPTPAGRVRP
jgi:hypothetical protein